MKRAWKQLWKAVSALLTSILNICLAAEAVSEGVKDDAIFGNEKAAAKREKKRAAWATKQP
jgi:hypothetical protein